MSSTTSQTASHFLLSFPFLSLFCLGNQLVVATGYGVLHRLSWEGKFDSSLAIHLNQVPIGNDLLPESKGTHAHTHKSHVHMHTHTHIRACTHTHAHTHTHTSSQVKLWEKWRYTRETCSTVPRCMGCRWYSLTAEEPSFMPNLRDMNHRYVTVVGEPSFVPNLQDTVIWLFFVVK